MGVSVFLMWIVNFAIALVFPVLTSAIGPTLTFVLFAVLGIGAIVFNASMLPETKGRSLEALEEEFRVKYA
jgi:MFS transporter, SP family, major inositol transporter